MGNEQISLPTSSDEISLYYCKHHLLLIKPRGF